jgi:L-threonylcarbamoyladenylate synthase
MHILDLSITSERDTAKKAVAELNRGSIIVYPTDTVYGLGVDALNAEAIQNVQRLKGRTSVWPLLIVVPDIASIEKYAVMNDAAWALATKFLPGPLSLVLPARDILPKELQLQGTIGIRIPGDPFCIELARQFGRPYTSTSANRTRQHTPTTVHEVIKQFGHDAHEISLAVDDGERAGGKPSTVVSCTGPVPIILREGAISSSEFDFVKKY